MKKLIFITGIALLFVFLCFLFFVQEDKDSAPSAPNVTGNVLPPTPNVISNQNDLPLAQNELVVSTKDGNFLPVRNFLQDEEVQPWPDESVYLVDSEQGMDGPIYQVFYFANDASLVVSLQEEPLSYARELAERSIRERLKLGEIGMCALKVRVTVPLEVDEELSGRNLGLSFCPGSIQL